MGLLIKGQWVDQWYDTSASGGRFQRQESAFRSWVTADGAAGPTGRAGFKAAPGRYHLYVSYACPWAHRTLIFRALKGLEDMISLSVVNWLMGQDGWTFEAGPGVIPDPMQGARFLHQVYTAAQADYSGRVTVPVLWDKQTGIIVSNESAEIIRMFNAAFDDLGAKAGDYYPEALRDQIDAVNARIYATVNNGVYKCGFATSQEAYEEAVHPLFDTLDWIEARVQNQDFLVGDQVTEADWRLFTTLVRFDAVYVGHFKTNLKPIKDYPAMSAYLKRLYAWPGVKETVQLDHIKGHYFQSHRSLNPSAVIPLGPELPFLS